MPAVPTVFLIAALTAGLIVGSTAAGPYPVTLNRSNAELFVASVKPLTWKGDSDQVTLQCAQCKAFYHATFFTVYGALNAALTPSFVANVHVCFTTAGNTVTANVCAKERRGFPVAPGFLRALEIAVSGFHVPLFASSAAVLANGTEATAAVLSRTSGAAVDTAAVLAVPGDEL
jgi:hypothetical protein